MSQVNEECLNAILSNEYLDIIVAATESPEELAEKYNATCYQIISSEYIILHIKADSTELCDYSAGGLELTVLNDVGIFGHSSYQDKDNNQAIPIKYPQTLTGKDVIVGMVDSGIDYRLPLFINENGTSKILSIWDQTIQGNPPPNFLYGTEYTWEDINEALSSEDPFEVVPHTDETGDGTFLTGLIAGNYDDNNDFSGIAPEADIVVVKLKESKEVMREFQMIFDPSIPTYQDTDIMLGINYLLEKAQEYQKPIVIPIGLSNNDGTHDGRTIFERYISDIADITGIIIIVCAGNEADKGHHYNNELSSTGDFQDVEYFVEEGEEGFQMLLFGSAPDILSISLISPYGDRISRVTPRYVIKERYNWQLDETLICLDHYLFPGRIADQLFLLKFYKPTNGIWTLRVYGDLVVKGRYDIWLPREGLILPETSFINPRSDTTITIPSTTSRCITVGAYNQITGALYVASGRGFTRDDIPKPSLVAPGMNIYGPYPENEYGSMTGTGVSSAVVAGVSAQLLEWGLIEGNYPTMNTLVAENLLIKSARRRPIYDYPNNAWGYGELDVINLYKFLNLG